MEDVTVKLGYTNGYITEYIYKVCTSNLVNKLVPDVVLERHTQKLYRYTTENPIVDTLFDLNKMSVCSTSKGTRIYGKYKHNNIKLELSYYGIHIGKTLLPIHNFTLESLSFLDHPLYKDLEYNYSNGSITYM